MSETFADDLLDGADAIGAFINANRRRVYHLCENQLIPATKIGGRWQSRKSTIEAYYARKLEMETGK